MSLLRIGSRGSQLALKQVAIVEQYLKGINHPYCVQFIKTSGDMIQDRPLYDIGGKALFSKEIERALLSKAVDLGVHSLKDLETPRPVGLMLCAFLPRADARDVLVTEVDLEAKTIRGCPVQDLSKGAVVGTSSPRRMAQLHHQRADLELINIRGNVETRLQKVGKACDAVILAKAGLDRLGYQVEDTACVPLHDMVPSGGQGIIALECRSDDTVTQALLKGMNDTRAEQAAMIERGIIEGLNASCRSAVGIHAIVNDSDIAVSVFMENQGITTLTQVFAASTPQESIILEVLKKLPKFS